MISIRFAKAKSLKKLFSTRAKFFSEQFKLQPHQNFLRIFDQKNNYYDFHYYWLRHNCSCKVGCCNEKSNERVLSSNDFSMGIFPMSQVINSENKVIIEWSEGNHKSIYDLNYLLEYAYSKNRKEVPEPYINLSNVVIDYNTFGSSTQDYFRKVKSTLENYDACIVKNFGLDTDKLITDFGGEVFESHFGKIEDLRTDNTTNKNTDQLGYTNAAVGLHTDQAFIANPPRYQALHCITPAEFGGESYFANTKFIMKYMRQNHYSEYKLITTVPVTFDRRQKEFKSKITAPIIEIEGEDADGNPNVKMVRFSYFTYAPFKREFHEMEEFYKAHNLFTELCKKYRYQTKLMSGDFVIYNNYINLHARTAFEGKRHLRGIYFTKDHIDKVWKANKL